LPAPSNLISLGAARADAGKGMTRLSIAVPGPGTLSLGGPKVVAQTRSTAAAGTVEMAVRPKAKAREALRRNGKLRVAFTVAFTPSGGTTSSQGRRLTLRWSAPK
jgi:hypothetical protein